MLARGQSADYRFDGYDNSVGAWIWIELGSSDGLDVSGQEPYDVALEYSESGETLRARADTVKFFTLDLGDEELPTVAIDEAGFGMCPLAQQASDGETAMVGYARLEGGLSQGQALCVGTGAAIGALSGPVQLRGFPSIRQDQVVHCHGRPFWRRRPAGAPTASPARFPSPPLTASPSPSPAATDFRPHSPWGSCRTGRPPRDRPPAPAESETGPD